MIKGTERRIIMVKETNSPYFDSAYFVIKSGISQAHRESDIISEANRMIEGCNKPVPAGEVGRFYLSKKALAFLLTLGALIGGVGGFMLSLIF